MTERTDHQLSLVQQDPTEMLKSAKPASPCLHESGSESYCVALSGAHFENETHDGTQTAIQHREGTPKPPEYGNSKGRKKQFQDSRSYLTKSKIIKSSTSVRRTNLALKSVNTERNKTSTPPGNDSIKKEAERHAPEPGTTAPSINIENVEEPMDVDDVPQSGTIAPSTDIENVEEPMDVDDVPQPGTIAPYSDNENIDEPMEVGDVPQSGTIAPSTDIENVEEPMDVDDAPQPGTTAPSTNIENVEDNAPQPGTTTPSIAIENVEEPMDVDGAPQPGTTMPSTAIENVEEPMDVDGAPQPGTTAPSTDIENVEDNAPQPGTTAPYSGNENVDEPKEVGASPQPGTTASFFDINSLVQEFKQLTISREQISEDQIQKTLTPKAQSSSQLQEDEEVSPLDFQRERTLNEVTKILRCSGSNNQIVAKVRGVSITYDDMKSLDKPNGLKYRVMDAYLALLAQELCDSGKKVKHETVHTMTSIINGAHGLIDEIIEPQKGLLYFHNPLGDQPQQQHGALQNWRSFMSRVAKKDARQSQKWKLSSKEHSIQDDNYNCGVYCLMFAERHLKGYPLTNITQEDADRKRRDIASSLMLYRDKCSKCGRAFHKKKPQAWGEAIANSSDQRSFLCAACELES